MKGFILYANILILTVVLVSCNKTTPPTSDWIQQLTEDVNLLGHRNWIVVTDMAYPLQSQAGIQTIYTNASYEEVLTAVDMIINKSPHVQSIVYQDKELTMLNDDDVEGISKLKSNCSKILGDNIIYLKHDHLIATIDSVSKIFNVIILKTNLTIPYTTTFFELDCKYWNENKQSKLNEKEI